MNLPFTPQPTFFVGVDTDASGFGSPIAVWHALEDGEITLLSADDSDVGYCTSSVCLSVHTSMGQQEE